MKLLIALSALTLALAYIGHHHLGGVHPDKFELYQKHVLQATREMKEANYSAALQHFELALTQKEGKPGDYLNAALCAHHLNQSDKILHWISEAILHTDISKKDLLGFDPVFEQEEHLTFINENFSTLRNKFYQTRPDLAIYLEVERLKLQDQFARILPDYSLGITPEQKEEAFDHYFEAQATGDEEAIKKYSAILFPERDEALQNYQSAIMKTVDSLNFVRLREICIENGWQENAWILLWHHRGTFGTDHYVWEFFKPFIDNEIASGRVSKSFWAPFEDFISIQTNGFSKYGYHPGKVDPESVNTFRKEVGLPSLKPAEIEERNNNPFSGRMY